MNVYSKIVFLIILCFISCSSTSIENNGQYKLLTKGVLKSRLTKDVNLLFFYTSWCGVSDIILKETYQELCNRENEFSITLISVDDLESEISLECDIYTLEKSYFNIPGAHRGLIKDFIQENFYNFQSINLKGNFKVPVSIFVDKDFNIIHSAPQKLKDLERLAKYHLKNKVIYQNK